METKTIYHVAISRCLLDREISPRNILNVLYNRMGGPPSSHFKDNFEGFEVIKFHGVIPGGALNVKTRNHVSAYF